ncbi:MAG TPA: AI-2E family transporter [Candidatus Paceibacterota bacterium]
MGNTTIDISVATFFKAILVVGLFGLLYILRDLVLVLLTAVVIASAIEPGTRWFVQYKVPRIIAVIFIYGALVGGIFGIAYFFIPPILEEVSNLLTTLGNKAGVFDFPSVNEGMLGGGIINSIEDRFSPEQAVLGAQNILSNVTGNVFGTIHTIFGGILSFILIVVISFYLAVQERGIENFLQIITPLKHEKYIINLWKRSQAKIGLWMQGQLLLGLFVGIFVFLPLAILGMKHALLLAILAAIFELIPLFGPVLAAIPAVALGFSDSVTLGFMVLGVYIIIQQFENHLIYPLVVRKVVGVSPILVIISLVIGAELAGFLGILLAVPIAATLVELSDDIQREKIERQKASA